MVLNNYRARVDGILTSLSRPFMRLHPNTITLISLVIAFFASLSYYLSWLFLSFIFIFISALLDAIDGKVARMRNLASKKGDFLDHAIDRYADTIILLGIIFSPYATMWIGIFALVGVYMTSYMGTQAQALGLGRIYGGILGRADRLVILMLLPILQFFWWGYYLSVTDWVLLIFAILGNITALQRFYSAWKMLS